MAYASVLKQNLVQLHQSAQSAGYAIWGARELDKLLKEGSASDLMEAAMETKGEGWGAGICVACVSAYCWKGMSISGRIGTCHGQWATLCAYW